MTEPKVPELYVTNLNKRFTGVSSTARAVMQQHLGRYATVLVGVGLPGLPAPVTKRAALAMARKEPEGRPFSIWHVRRNTEMQLAILARDVLRLPVRIVFTSAAKRRHSLWPRFLMSRMDRTIATSDAAASFLHVCHAVVPHGIDTVRFCPAKDRAAAWAATGFAGDYGIVSVGRLRPEKGTDTFVDAMIAALPRLPGATAVLVGLAKPSDRRFVDTLKARIADAGLTGRFVFTGALDSDDLIGILQGCRLLCAVPRYEGFGVTVMEGMACGLPAVATPTGHFAEAIGAEDAPDCAGRIVPVGSAAAAADAVVWALSDPARWVTLSANARARVQRLFSIQREADAVAEIYEDLWRNG